MPFYRSRFVSSPDPKHIKEDINHLSVDGLNRYLRHKGVRISSSSHVSNPPRICFTCVDDEIGYQPYSELGDEELKRFEGAISIGENSLIESDPVAPPFQSACVKFTSVSANGSVPGQIKIGNNVQIFGASIVAYEQVLIEDNVVIAPLVTIMDCDGHALYDRGSPDEIAQLTPRPVVIGEQSWIGANAWIMKGVTIGKNAVIGANSVVTKSVPDNTVVAGNPARVIRTLGAQVMER